MATLPRARPKASLAAAPKPTITCTLELISSRRGLGQPVLLLGTPHDGKAAYVYLSARGEMLHEPVAREGGEEAP